MPTKEVRPRHLSYPPFRLGRHGIGPLRHPFDDAMLSAGAARTQWDLIQKPKGRIFRWRFDEEEDIVLDLIHTTSQSEDKSLLDYMSDNEFRF